MSLWAYVCVHSTCTRARVVMYVQVVMVVGGRVAGETLLLSVCNSCTKYVAANVCVQLLY